MSRCFEHDYESVFCRNCGGYCGEACINCSSMWDGGETAVATREWCHCDNQVFDFGFEEPESKEVRPTPDAAHVLVRCAHCGALLETDVHCDNCGSFHPTRR